MAIDSESQVSAPERVRPLRRAEYDKLVEEGFFANERIELLRGLLVEKSPQNPPHAGAIERLNVALQARLGERAHVRVQLPLAVSEDSEPEPDFAVVAPHSDWTRHPASALLVVEVADTSLTRDLRVKADLYAQAAVAECWVVDLAQGVVVVHTEPSPGRYGRITTRRRSESISLVAFPDFSLSVDAILG